MRRDELLARLNRRAKSRYRLTSPHGLPITDGMLTDWREADLIPEPLHRGRKRDWTSRHYRRALEVVRLRSQGVRSLPLARAIFFIKGIPGVPPPDTESRKALAATYIKLKNELVGHIHSTYPLGNMEKDTAWRKRTVLGKMGGLDDSLAELIQYKPHELLSAYASARFNHQQSEFDDAARRLMQNVVTAFFHTTATETAPPILVSIRNASAVFGGVWGQSTEFETPDHSICSATEQEFLYARIGFNQSIPLFRVIGNEKVAYTLTVSWQWRVWMFVLLLDFIHRQRGKQISCEIEFAGKSYKISGLPSQSDIIGALNSLVEFMGQFHAESDFAR